MSGTDEPEPTGIGRTHRSCRAAVAHLPVDGASLVVGGWQGARQLVLATDAISAQLDELQYTLGEGPCIDSYRTRRPVLIPDLETAAVFARWPGFAHEATQVGARAAFAFPLQVAVVPFGIVEFYSCRPGPLPQQALDAALEAVDDMVRIVLDELSAALDSSETGHPAWLGRSQVAQASGMVSVQLGISVPDALAQLRAHAFAQHRLISDLADDVVTHRYAFTGDR